MTNVVVDISDPSGEIRARLGRPLRSSLFCGASFELSSVMPYLDTMPRSAVMHTPLIAVAYTRSHDVSSTALRKFW